jgi:hypothetical protein
MQPLLQHRSRRGEAHGGVPRTILRWEPGANTQAPLRLTRPSWATHPLIPIPAGPSSTLAALARMQREQLEVVSAGVTACLQRGVEGRTRLASLRPVAR